MSTPAPPAITTASFRGEPFPSHVAEQVLNMLIGGSPFSNSVSRFPTMRSTVAFPVASPDRPGWVPEMADIPIANLNPDADIVAVAKLATIVLMSNESIHDSSINLTGEVETLLRDSASAELDRGVLYGTNSPEPRGVVAAAQPAAGPDLAAALTAAIGSVGDAGGEVTHIAARPSVLADARNLRDNEGVQLYPSGIGPAFGVTEVGVPELSAGDILAYDSSRIWLINRNDFTVDVSQDFAFRQDAAAIRIRGRFAVAAPVISKSLRRLDIGGNGSNGNGSNGVAGIQAAPAKASTVRTSKNV